jgi:hypothetical protein
MISLEEREELLEAGESLVNEGNYNKVTSAALLGELLIFTSKDWDSTWREYGEEVYDRLLEIARAYLRGA